MVNREYPSAPVASVGVVVQWGDRVLWARRGQEPSRDRWSVPGGVVELGETIRQAAARELREECDVEAEVGAVLEVVDAIHRDERGRVRYHYVLTFLLADYTRGEPAPASDVTEVRWVDLHELAALDIPARTRAIVERVLRRGDTPVPSEEVKREPD